MRHDVLKEKLREWADANTASGVKVIFANQNAPRPDFSYVTILVTSKQQKEHASYNCSGETGINFESTNDQDCSVSIQAFGSDAFSIIEDLRDSLSKRNILQDLREAGIVFVRVASGVNDLSSAVQSRFEERAGMDIMFRIAVTVTEDTEIIESVEGLGSINGEDYQVNYNIGV